MRICGIVSEYNPFHAGHAWHIAQARQRSGADLIVCAMSGSFVQRGEPALFDKWTRAACAIRCGADAVAELPLLSAIQSAEGFALGGVRQLHALGAEALSFGCETADIGALTQAAKILSAETEEFRRALRQRLDEGDSYPAARMKAALSGEFSGETLEILCSPNAILGVEYIKAMLQSGAEMTPCVVPRTGGAYHSADMADTMPSATALRTAFRAGKAADALSAMPEACRQYVQVQVGAGLVPAYPEVFDTALLLTLRRNGRDSLRCLPDISEGLENRIFDAAQRCTTREELIAAVKTKRYAYTRISRVMLYALLDITREAVREHNRSPVSHVRLLAVKSPEVLSALSKTSRVPIVAGSAANSPYPALDAAATDVWALSQSISPFRDGFRDFTQKLLINP